MWQIYLHLIIILEVTYSLINVVLFILNSKGMGAVPKKMHAGGVGDRNSD